VPEALEAGQQATGLGLRSNRPRVYVVTSLAGGTGGGLFVDLAYLIRQQLKQIGYEAPDGAGGLLGPDGPAPAAPGWKAPAAEPGQRGAEQRRVMALGNAYAALTELRHFASPEKTFAARYQEKEPPLRDRDAPFDRWVLLPLPGEGDEATDREVTA